MEILSSVLPVVIDILLIVLLTVGIILLIKCIYIVDKTKAILLNVEEKVNSLNSIFAVINTVSTRFSLIADKTVGFIENFILKLFKGKKDDEFDCEDEL